MAKHKFLILLSVLLLVPMPAIAATIENQAQSLDIQLRPNIQRKLEIIESKYTITTNVLIGTYQQEQRSSGWLGLADHNVAIDRAIALSQPGQYDLSIVLLFQEDDPDRYLVAAATGDRLRSMGIETASLNSQNGLIDSAVSRHLPDNPDGAILAIAAK